MNKKNITINTDFFDEGSEAKLVEYNEQHSASLQAKEVSSRVGQYQKDSVQNSVNSYRYEFVPDNEYSHEEYHRYEESSILARKIQAANEFQNIISRAMASLFVRCWQELKAILPEYHYLSQHYKTSQQAQKEQILQDYNNVFNNSNEQNHGDQVEQSLRENVFLSRQNNNLSIQARKRQIMERQRQGITLDSLEKLKIHRSKSGPRLQTEKDFRSSLKQNQESKETFVNDQVQEKSVSGMSRKSYREKFIEYKHRSRSKEPGMLKSQTYTKFVSYLPSHTQQQQNTSINRTFVSKGIRNVQSASHILESKNDILRNINHLLMDREDIYQGEDYRYYINHRDSSKHIYPTDTYSYLNYPGSSYTGNLKVGFNQQQSTQNQTYDEEMMRARLIEEIVEKLKYSKIRLEEVQKKEPKNDELEMMRKITRLQKVIHELKTQTQTKSHVREPQVRPYQKSAQQELYRKFVQEMATIKAQINLIKTLRQSTPPPAPLPQPQSIVVDNSSSHIISEQQKLLSNYQREYERLLHEREKQKVIVVPKQPEPQPILQQSNTGETSMFDQLIQKGKSSTKKVGWDDGWQVKQEKKEVHLSENVNSLSNQVIQMTRSRMKNQHLNKQGVFQNYRYTRKQVLQDIGLRSQVEQEERIWRETLARQQLDRERRQIEVREMTEKVKLAKSLQSQTDGFEDRKSIRQKHEENSEKSRKQRMDEDVNQNIFCQLFPCK